MRNSTRKTLILALLFPLLGGFSEAFGLCVNVSQANLREGPSTTYKKLWTFYKYMPLKEIDEKNGWIKIKDVDGYPSWIHAGLITTDYDCAVIKTKIANLRSGPGTNYAQTGEGERYHSFKVIKAQGSWIHIEDEYRQRYWISRSLVWIS